MLIDGLDLNPILNPQMYHLNLWSHYLLVKIKKIKGEHFPFDDKGIDLWWPSEHNAHLNDHTNTLKSGQLLPRQPKLTDRSSCIYNKVPQIVESCLCLNYSKLDLVSEHSQGKTKEDPGHVDKVILSSSTFYS